MNMTMLFKSAIKLKIYFKIFYKKNYLAEVKLLEHCKQRCTYCEDRLLLVFIDKFCVSLSSSSSKFPPTLDENEFCELLTVKLFSFSKFKSLLKICNFF